jgi:hypothetical protein
VPLERRWIRPGNEPPTTDQVYGERQLAAASVADHATPAVIAGEEVSAHRTARGLDPRPVAPIRITALANSPESVG